MQPHPGDSRDSSGRGIALIALFALVACANKPSAEEIEAAKNSYGCQLSGERLVVRYDTGEVRLLMPDGSPVRLYQISSGSVPRYSNGLFELRGKMGELQLIQDGVATALTGCEQFPLPK